MITNQTNQRRLQCLAVLVALAAVATTSVASEVPIPSPNASWSMLKTPHFRIISDARAWRVRDAARQLETLTAALGKATRLSVNLPALTTVLLPGSRVTFRSYCEFVVGRSCADLGGLYQSGEFGDYILIDGSDFDNARHLAFHELTHAIVRNSGPGVPLWLDEGLAEFYANFWMHGSDIRLGLPDLNHLAEIRDHGLLPIATWLDVTHTSREYTARDLHGIYYAQSWLTVHYLLIGAPQRKGQLTRYLHALSAGEQVEAAFTASFGCTTEDFFKELRTYSQRPTMSGLKFLVTDLGTEEPSQPVPIPRDELLSRLAEILAQRGPDGPDAAMPLIDEALESAPNSASALAMKGWFLSRKGQFDAATPVFDRAIAAGPLSPLPYVLFGTHLLRRIEGPAGLGGSPSPADLVKARDLFDRALALSPDYVPALIGFAQAFQAEPRADLTAAISRLDRAYTLAPGRSDVPFLLAQFLGNAGQYSRAGQVIDRSIAAHPDAAVRSQARELRIFLQTSATRELLNSGDTAGAVRVLERGLAETRDPEMIEFLSGELTRIRESERVKEAVDMANHGDRAGALRSLGELLPTLTDLAAKTQATTLLESLQEAHPPTTAPPSSTSGVRTSDAIISPKDSEDRRRAIERETRSQHEAELYNQAVTLHNRGDSQGALKIVEELATSATNAEVKTAAVAFRARILARLGRR